MKIKPIIAAMAALAVSACSTLKDGEYNLSVVSTGDGHGYWFAKPIEDGGRARGSLMAQSAFVNGVRAEKGADNVILIDAGDNFFGSGAPFYYNYVDTTSSHLYPRLASYMKYDAVVAGHSDFESGHRVYDRVAKEMKKEGIPLLAGNALSDRNGKPYFPAYSIIKKGGVKVAVLGYTNAANASLMDGSCVSGLRFESLLPLVQEDVDKVRSKEKPHIVIVVAHTAMGKGDGLNLEKQGLDLFKSLRGVDVVVTGHDHANKVMSADSIVVLDCGRTGQNAGVTDIKLVVKGGKVVSRTLDARMASIKNEEYDTAMEEAFEADYDKVHSFITGTVGEIKKDLVSREFYYKQCDYMNFLHTLAMSAYPVDISLSATLLIDGKVPAGEVRYQDIRKVYPYENKLVVLRLTGAEILKYLEASYDAWINTVAEPSEGAHVLKIKQSKDYSTGKMAWKLAKSPANFDSAAGINYTVDVTKPYGSRIVITGMADGSKFELDKEYTAAITTYRSVGSGGLLKAAGLTDAKSVEDRIVYRGPEFRTILYRYFKKNGSIDPSVVGDPKVVGSWKFLPESAPAAIKADVELLYGK